MLFTIINFAGFWGVVSEKKFFFCYLVVSLPFLCRLSLSLSLSLSLCLQRSVTLNSTSPKYVIKHVICAKKRGNNVGFVVLLQFLNIALTELRTFACRVFIIHTVSLSPRGLTFTWWGCRG